MNDRNPSTITPATPSPPAKGRRRFLGAGVSATPALLTLASQPALGVTCFTPSRSLSRNTSEPSKQRECFGESPGNYGAQTDRFMPNGKPNPAYNWPIPPETLFHSETPALFCGNAFMIDLKTGGQRSLTFLEVITLSPQNRPKDMSPTDDLPIDPSNLAKHLAAAYLNCLNEFIPEDVLSPADVLAIWCEWYTNGYFAPMAGVQWDAAQIVQYLKSNGIVK